MSTSKTTAKKPAAKTQAKSEETKAAEAKVPSQAVGNAPALQAAEKTKTKPPAQPVHVDGTNRRLGTDALEGGWVRFLKGDYKGKVASFEQVLDRETDGYPKEILVRTRDEFDQLLTVAYKDVEAALDFHGGR